MFFVYHINKRGVKEIFIFKGYDPDDSYRVEVTDTETIKSLLTDKYKYEESTRIFLINDSIFQDDSIDFIKRKFMMATKSIYGFNELYSFGYVSKVYSNREIYNILSQNDSIAISYNRLYQFILNIYDIDISHIELKEDYSYEDIIALNIENKSLFVKTPVGQKFYIEASYPVPVNPFDCIEFDTILKNSGESIVSTQNKSLLLDYPDIELNTLYICTPDDVINFVNNNNSRSLLRDGDVASLPIDMDVMFKLYYPFLFKDGIFDERNYNERKTSLLANNSKLLSDVFKNNNNNIILFNSIHEKKSGGELDYITRGIKNISFIIEPQNPLNIPLEVIFKLINTDKNTPFIKFNPGKSKEKLYRLFTNNVTKDGRKIPYLPKEYIVKLRATTARQKMVTLHSVIKSKYVVKDSKREIYINTSFLENGSVLIDFMSDTSYSIDEINDYVNQYSTKHIDTIRKFLEQKGYNYIGFTSIYQKNIVFQNIEIFSILNIEKKININKYIGCFSSIVNIIEDDVDKGIELRYKRVSYFNKMDSIDAYITNLVNNKYDRGEIVQKISENFNITDDESNEKYRNWISNIQVEQQVNENKKLKIKSNPGFMIIIKKVPFKNSITINISLINNVKYVPLILKYIDSIIRITQSKTGLDSSVQKMCNSKEINIAEIEDIESKVEEELQMQNGLLMTSDMIQFDGSDIEDDDGILGLLIEEDEDEEYDDEIPGLSFPTEDIPNNLDLDFGDDEGEGEIGDIIDEVKLSSRPPGEDIETPESSKQLTPPPHSTLKSSEQLTPPHSTVKSNAKSSNKSSVKSSVKSSEQLTPPHSTVKSPANSPHSSSEKSPKKCVSKLARHINFEEPELTNEDIMDSENELDFRDIASKSSSKSISERSANELDFGEIQKAPVLSLRSIESSNNDIDFGDIASVSSPVISKSLSSKKSDNELDFGDIASVSSPVISKKSDNELDFGDIASPVISKSLSESCANELDFGDIASASSPVISKSLSESSANELDFGEIDSNKSSIIRDEMTSKELESSVNSSASDDSGGFVDDLEFGAGDVSVSNSIVEKSQNRPLRESVPLDEESYSGSSGSDSDDSIDFGGAESVDGLVFEGGNSPSLESDVAGMPLKNPNVFFSKMVKLDPKLFLKRKTGKFNAYSRTCPTNVRRQPVILTDSEKERIDRVNPGSYSKALRYGSSPDNQHWYICPRYWCLKTNSSMTEEDVKAGKCGGSDKIIPQNARVVPKDAFVYEFSDKKEHINQKGEYVQHYPGFVKEGSHPDDLCIPCCFKSWDSPVQQMRRDKCLSGKKLEIKPKKDGDGYIKGAEKHPLDINRWGYLPLSIQKLLKTDNSKCYSKTGKGIKPFEYCMLRKGIEDNKNQSFIGVLADIYLEFMKIKRKSDKSKISVPTIKEMKDIIIESIDIDKFVTLFNGSLIDTFSRESLSINVNKYSDSVLFKGLKVKTDKDSEEYFKKIASAYENYIDFLRDDDIIIDHTYLWDVVHIANDKLFPNGINLVILEIPNNDMTENVEIICPTNSYSSQLFDIKKPTLIMMLKDGYYEPIYVYRDEETRIKVSKVYSLFNHELLPNLKNVIKIIKQSYTKCGPKNSMPKEYIFKSNLFFEDIKQELERFGAEIENQVINYNQKVVGVIARLNSGKSGFIPIEPSSINSSIKSLYLDDVEWKNFIDTERFLKKINEKSQGKIPSKPSFKVMEDNLIVGIITETNQFVLLNEPYKTTDSQYDYLKEMNGYNTISLDKEILYGDTTYDKQREKVVKFIELESNYYDAFRNTGRLLLNDYDNLKVRREILSILDDKSLFYIEKIQKIKRRLMRLLDEHVEFSAIPNNILLETDSINLCMTTDSDDDCKLIIPHKHLISNNNNREIYYLRLSDEITRYGIINNYIFNPHSNLVLNNVDYKLGNNEIILLDTLLMDGYFDDLEAVYRNKYINNIGDNFIEPQKSVTYGNNIEFTLQDSPNKYDDLDSSDNGIPTIDDSPKAIERILSTINCIKRVKRNMTGIWGKYFPSKYIESFYKDTIDCSFEMFLSFVRDYKGDSIQGNLTSNNLKEVLVELYDDLIKTYGETLIIRKILFDQGKHSIKNKIISGEITFEQSIMSSDYYLTNLDLILLARHYDIPLVILSSIQMNELRGWNIGNNTELETNATKDKKFTDLRKMWIVNRKKEYEKYYFIRQLGIINDSPQRYTLIHNEGHINNPREDIKENLWELMTEIYYKRPSFKQSIENYKNVKNVKRPARGRKLIIKEDTPKVKKNIRRKIPKKLVIMDDDSIGKTISPKITPKKSVKPIKRKRIKKKLVIKD